MKIIISLVSLLACTALAQARAPALGMSLLDITHTVEGIVFGVLKAEVSEGALENCLNEAESIEGQLVAAARDLESLTFNGIRRGLQEAGTAMKMVPELVKDCQNASTIEYSKLVHMADMFMHPLSLVYQVGKSLIVNGADIYNLTSTAVASYKAGEYYNFGLFLGKALDEVFTKAQGNDAVAPHKRPVDEKAFDFLLGFMSSVEGLVVDWQTLYNDIDGKGAMLYGPVEAALRNIDNHKDGKPWESDHRVWLALHEVEHVFQEGGEMLVAYSLLSVTGLELVRDLAACLDDANLSVSNVHDVLGAFTEAVTVWRLEDNQGVGAALGTAANLLCGNYLYLSA